MHEETAHKIETALGNDFQCFLCIGYDFAGDKVTLRKMTQTLHIDGLLQGLEDLTAMLEQVRDELYLEVEEGE